MTRAEKRRLHRLLNPTVHANVRALRLMVDDSLMTVPRAMEFLDVELQTARNCLCKLVHTKHAVIVTPKAPARPATYRVTEAGRQYLEAFEQKLADEMNALLGEGDDEESREEAREAALTLADLAAGRKRAEENVALARSGVPNSVFALGSIFVAAGQQGARA
jgi:hypothetical protein